MDINQSMFIMVLVAVAGGLCAVYQAEPSLLRYIFAASLAGLGVRLWQLYSESRRTSRASASIDFDSLRGKDFSSYAGWLKDNVRGQDEAVDRVVKRLTQGLSLAGRGRLLGSFILVGPTGTGKTFLAELTAKALYPDVEPVLLRMNQYKTAEDVDALVGAGGSLTAPVIENPRRVVIFDEFDKCHPAVSHCVYDLLDTGLCREKGSGRVAHFNACAVFATANAGTEELRGAKRGAGEASLREALAEAGFEKALVARFDEVLLMDELAPIHVAEVVALQLAKHWRQYGIEVDYAAPELLLEAVKRNAAFREYGVRQLARVVQELTDATLDQAKKTGATKVRLGLDGATGRAILA